MGLPAPGELIPNGSVHRFVYEDGGADARPFNLGPEDRDLFTGQSCDGRLTQG